jgi:cellulose synthase/poly-beta-1,6-N-acetylglucosamine synthase-like glycosyltransferase
MLLLSWLYVAAVAGLAVFGFNMLLMLAVAVWPRRPRPAPPPPEAWPAVVVQLPVFNERYVVERLIDAAAALDYPRDRLTIQVLDDSTDDTAALAKARVAYHRARGRRITHHHRARRAGFKAGALAEGLALALTSETDEAQGLAAAPGELVAVFDADFLPPPDFLRRTAPLFCADPRLGMVQARWEHLNPDQSALTRAQALASDGYFAVDQVARSRAGWLMNFNGSAGVWRRAAIEAAGNWQGDTLAEDLDLSYRAQLNGWRLDYLPDVAVPAELPASLAALKRQQFRWATGSFQVLRKLGPRLWRAHMPLWRKALGFLHLAGYIVQPLMLAVLLLSLPVVLLHGRTPVSLGVLGLAGLGPPLVGLWGQVAFRRGWPQRMRYYPVLLSLGIGLALTSTRALWAAFFGRRHAFLRTPKATPVNPRDNVYALPVDWTTWGELVLALYALATGLLALDLAPGLAPLICLYALGFGYTAGLEFWQAGWGWNRKWHMAAWRDE